MSKEPCINLDANHETHPNYVSLTLSAPDQTLQQEQLPLCHQLLQQFPLLVLSVRSFILSFLSPWLHVH